MFSFFPPGITGLSNIRRFRRCFLDYADAAGVIVHPVLLDGREPAGAARDFVTAALDEGYPVMYLLLRHRDPALDDYTWHWFNLTGYEADEGGMTVEFATWGKKHSADFDNLWDTGAGHKGGMVVIR